MSPGARGDDYDEDAMTSDQGLIWIDAVVFDLGGVLIDWHPRHLYRRLFDGDERAVQHFLNDVCTADWIRQQDMGKPVAQAVAELAQRFPEHAHLITKYDTCWEEMLAGPLDESVLVVAHLHRAGRAIYGLTNLPSEKYPLLRRRLDFLDCFQGVLVSGDVGCAKPDPEIYRRLIATHGLAPETTLYFDDVWANVAGARAVGMHAFQFSSAKQLRADLDAFGLL